MEMRRVDVAQVIEVLEDPSTGLEGKVEELRRVMDATEGFRVPHEVGSELLRQGLARAVVGLVEQVRVVSEKEKNSYRIKRKATDGLIVRLRYHLQLCKDKVEVLTKELDQLKTEKDFNQVYLLQQKQLTEENDQLRTRALELETSDSLRNRKLSEEYRYLNKRFEQLMGQFIHLQEKVVTTETELADVKAKNAQLEQDCYFWKEKSYVDLKIPVMRVSRSAQTDIPVSTPLKKPPIVLKTKKQNNLRKKSEPDLIPDERDEDSTYNNNHVLAFQELKSQMMMRPQSAHASLRPVRKTRSGNRPQTATSGRRPKSAMAKKQQPLCRPMSADLGSRYVGKGLGFSKN